MSAPKSVIKIVKGKNGSEVRYESNVDLAGYAMFELSRAALRDVGKFVSRKFKDGLKSNFRNKKLQGKAKYMVWSSKNTKYPRVQIGLIGGKGSKFNWWAYLQEFGTHDGSIPRLNLLTKATQENIAEIVKIESQYLSYLSDEASRLASLIDEKEMEGEA